LVVIVTPATSIAFSKPELDDFLYAPIGMEQNGMQLSVLSALAQLGLDPWKEAAELSRLSMDGATQRLAVLIVRLPGGRWTLGEAGEIAQRLIDLLPSHSSPDAAPIGKANGLPGGGGPPVAKMLICAALVGIALLGATSCDLSLGADMFWLRAIETAPNPARR
jgi:hypothetical protein